jgi:hypothetical protein
MSVPSIGSHFYEHFSKVGFMIASTKMRIRRMMLPSRIPWQRLLQVADRLVPNGTIWKRTLSTYYDSQSGMHVPLHKDDEVTACCSWNASEWRRSSTNNRLEMLAKGGIGGVLIVPGSPHEEIPGNIYSKVTSMTFPSWSP